MKLSDWAKEQVISYRTVWRCFKADQLPIKANGRRSAKNKAKKALETLQSEN